MQSEPVTVKMDYEEIMENARYATKIIDLKTNFTTLSR
jgi:hypothetical protein